MSKNSNIKKEQKKKKARTKEIIKKIALWVFLILLVVGMVFTYAITALAS